MTDHPAHRSARPHPRRAPARPSRVGWRSAACPRYRVGPDATGGSGQAPVASLGARPPSCPLALRAELDQTFPCPGSRRRRDPAIRRRDPEVPLAAGRRRGHRVGPDPDAAAAGRSASPRRPGAPSAAPSAPPAGWASAGTSRPSRSRARCARSCCVRPGGQADQHRLHGDGRAAAQLAGGEHRAHASSTRPRASASGPGTSPSPPSASCRAWRSSAERPEQFRLAISLHATDLAAAPARIMPIEKKYDLEAVLQRGGGVPEAGHVRVRDDRRGERHRRTTPTGWPSWRGGWARWSTSCRCIPAARPTSPRPRTGGSGAFADRLRNQGIEATVRRSRGLDIDAACGQLQGGGREEAAGGGGEGVNGRSGCTMARARRRRSTAHSLG